jgi:hypothetical protein
VENAMKRFERIEKDLDECEGVVADYKKTINGKFDKIMYSILGISLMVIGTLASTVWIQHNAKIDIDSKFKTIIEGKAIHQNISQENNNELTIVLRRLNDIEGVLTDAKRTVRKEKINAISR